MVRPTFASNVITSITTNNSHLGGADVITSGNGNEVILGGAGGDTITGGNGNDLILGHDGTVTSRRASR